jgi:hypothetical protein
MVDPDLVSWFQEEYYEVQSYYADHKNQIMPKKDAFFGFSTGDSYDDPKIQAAWEKFKKKHSKDKN